MNQPANPNKITAVIMICLAFSLMFIIDTAIQSYNNGVMVTQQVQVVSNTLKYLKNNSGINVKLNNSTNQIIAAMKDDIIIQHKLLEAMTNNTSTNKASLTKILVELQEINNKTR